jgi:hypothetical protein
MVKYVAKGVDFVKFGATGDDMPVDSIVGQEAVLRFTPAQQRAMVDAVHAAGIIIRTTRPRVRRPSRRTSRAAASITARPAIPS